MGKLNREIASIFGRFIFVSCATEIMELIAEVSEDYYVAIILF